MTQALTYSIHVVDDEQTIRDSLARALAPAYQVDTSATGEEALQVCLASPPDLMLLDIGLPGIDGLEVLRRCKEKHHDILVVMITAYEDIQTVIEAMKLGAHDYVVKPLNLDSLEVTIGNALETIRLRKEVQTLQARLLREHVPCIIGESDAIQDLMDYLALVARSPDTPILILGPTGTGKELVASAIHYRSPMCKGPIIAINCASLPEPLVESELFGYAPGAFSGAQTRGKAGLIEQAAGGTLFLDEVGDLSQQAQAKLLRFLEQGEFFRVGGTECTRVQTRIVSATNRNLEELTASGQFRQDLYYRLAVVTIDVPSLNERPGDIVPLAKHFLVHYRDKFAKEIRGLSPAAEARLCAHSWVGNVRELKNTIERAALVCRGLEIESEDLGLGPPAEGEPMPPLTAAGVDLRLLTDALERRYINEALRLSQGNESQAARLLGMNHSTFRYRKKKVCNDDPPQ